MLVLFLFCLRRTLKEQFLKFLAFFQDYSIIKLRILIQFPVIYDFNGNQQKNTKLVESKGLNLNKVRSLLGMDISLKLTATNMFLMTINLFVYSLSIIIIF